MKTLPVNIFLLTVFAVLTSCGSNTTENQAEESVMTLNVEGYKVKPEPFSKEVTATANLYAREQVELMAPMSGQVLEIYFKEGQSIQKGAPVIRMDDRSWKAQLTGLQAELDVANKDYERKKTLLEIEGSSQEEIDAVFSTIEGLKSQIQLLTLNIELANVTAPFSGRLGMRNFSKGAYLKEGEVITVLTELDKLKVDFEIPQEHKSSINLKKTVRVLIENDTLEATIYAINPLINRESRTVNVRAILRQPADKEIMPGTFAEVLITTNFIKDALLIPTQAVIPEINDQTVYVYKSGIALKKIIEIGSRTAEKVYVINGVSAGDTLITTGLLQIKDGMNVTLQNCNQ
ncbi:MAG: efflux RND transporter periplasmic adaptor subunit [Bacteroidota bacterium]